MSVEQEKTRSKRTASDAERVSKQADPYGKSYALHEELGQLLAAFRLHLSSFKNEHGGDPKLEERFDSMDQLIGQAFMLLRRISVELYPLGQDEDGLYHPLRMLARSLSEQHGIACKLIAEEENLQLEKALSLAVFRIVQNALEHIALHTHADEVLVKLRCKADRLMVTILDNGPRDQACTRRQKSAGISPELRDQTKALNGRLRWRSAADEGARLEISVPLHQPTLQ